MKRDWIATRPVTVREKRKGEGGVKTREQLREEKNKAMLAAKARQEDRRRIMNGMAPIVRGHSEQRDTWARSRTQSPGIPSFPVGHFAH